MKVQVRMFGSFQERFGYTTTELEVDSVAALKQLLEAEQPHIAALNYLVAVNQELVREDRPLRAGDEVALMPPFAGG